MKKTLILILCFSLLMVMAVGCQPAETTPSATTSEGETTTSETTTMGPPTPIVYVYPAFAEQVDQEIVEEKINEISLAKINVDVDIYPIGIANFSQQVPLMITGGEDMDLVLGLPGGPTMYSTMVAQGQLKDITDIAPMYAPGIFDAVDAVNPGFMAGAYIDGKLYGFPGLYDKVTETIMDMRKDVLVENNLLDAYMNANSITDLEAIAETLAAASDIPVMVSSGNAWGHVLASSARATNFDDFSSIYYSEFFSNSEWAYGAVYGNDNTNVVNAYDSDYYKKMIGIARDWYTKGYIAKDAATQVDMGYQMIQANGGLAQITDGELGHQTFASNQCGQDMITITLSKAVVNTGTIQKFMWNVPVSCDEDEAALKFLELTYIDPDVVNLINYGIEDTHYVMNDDGTISLPEGVASDSARYFVNATFMFGSQYLAYPVKPDPADLRDQALALNQDAAIAPLMGFSVNTANFTNEYTAVINVVTQYAPGLNSGSSDPETVLPQFLAALENAGYQTILDDVQAQVDAFVAAQ